MMSQIEQYLMELGRIGPDQSVRREDARFHPNRLGKSFPDKRRDLTDQAADIERAEFGPETLGKGQDLIDHL